ncbi:MAG: hypothetical protein GY777_16425 [Candidatus Brocadiaceae bacterium]|nr:hypothetical protein [Candidatus Brocadiaceae bacterium]
MMAENEIGKIVVNTAITPGSGVYKIMYEVEALEGSDSKAWGFNPRILKTQ